jgi:hypothetical protein
MPNWVVSDPKNSDKEIILCLGPRVRIVKKDFVEFIQIANEMLPAIKPGMKFTIQDLTGDEYWLSKSIYQRITLGRITSWLVNHGYTPFIYADDTCRTPKRYML